MSDLISLLKRPILWNEGVVQYVRVLSFRQTTAEPETAAVE
jgi:hypothetical protein